MTGSNFLPLGVAFLLLTPVIAAQFSPRVDRVLTRLALVAFGTYIVQFKDEHPKRVATLRSAHLPTTYREYGAKTVLYGALSAAIGAIAGIYFIWALLAVLALDPATLAEALPDALEFLANFGGVPSVTLAELFGLMLASCLTFGVATGGGTYWLRWWYPGYVADNRARRIERSLPETVAFIYALSRSGMEFPKVTRIVATHQDTYGEAAAEFEIVVRNMDTFGTDLITSLQMMGQRTPSPQFQEFTENLVSVLQSGHSLSAFLDRQYHDYREEAQSQQESMLELLGTLAESYVTVLVAGPLFLITVLVVIGFSVGDTIQPLTVLVYIVLPFGNLAFIIYLSTVTDKITPSRPGNTKPGDGSAADSRPRRADGGSIGSVHVRTDTRPNTDGDADATSNTDPTVETHTDSVSNSNTHQNLERIALYRRFRTTKEQFGNPRKTLIARPALLLLLTVPIALIAIGWAIPTAITDTGFDIGAIDTVLVLSTIFVIGTFSLVYELHRLRITGIESAVPDLLDRLASVNEAGMPIIAAIDQVRGSELGALDDELDRIWADVQWGATLETALLRFESRTRTHVTARVVTLLTEAMKASGNLSTVLRIAARQAIAERRLKRERRQAMLEYLVVVYVSFLVFLFIIAVLSAYLLPNLPTGGIETGDAGAGSPIDGLGGTSDFEAATYTQLFYHATLVQGALSGFIAGQLATGDVRAGAKHATAMMVLTFLLFAFVL